MYHVVPNKVYIEERNIELADYKVNFEQAHTVVRYFVFDLAKALSLALYGKKQ